MHLGRELTEVELVEDQIGQVLDQPHVVFRLIKYQEMIRNAVNIITMKI